MDDAVRAELRALLEQLRADVAIVNSTPLPGVVKRAVSNTGRVLEILVKLEVNHNV